MLPVVGTLSIFVVIGVDACGEKGFGLPDKLPACPVFVEAGEAEKVQQVLKRQDWQVSKAKNYVEMESDGPER